MTEIYLSSNHLMLRSGYGDPELHSHLAAHVLVSLSAPFAVTAAGRTMQCAGVRIPSGCPHTVRTGGEAILVFLFDATTAVAGQITEVQAIPPETAARIAAAYEAMRAAGDVVSAYPRFFAAAMELLGLPAAQQNVTDERILAAVRYIDANISGEVSAAGAARTACLSESRFSHLFRQQVGVTFASYALLRKLYHTYTAVAAGESITQAAVDAGFASPSHFAAVNKKLFGITASEVCGDLALYKIAEI